MKHSLMLAGFFAATLALAQPAAAQFGMRGFGGANRSADLDVQKQRNALKSQRQKYLAPPTPKTAPKRPALGMGTPGPYGRVDLSGRPAPGYATIRDKSAPLGSARHGGARPAPKAHAPRTPAKPRATRPAAPRVPPSHRIPPPPPIPSP